MNNLSKSIKRRVFWSLILHGIWLFKSRVIIGESFTDWNRINLGVKTVMVYFYYTPTVAFVEKVPLPLGRGDIEYLSRVFSKAYLRYKKRVK